MTIGLQRLQHHKEGKANMGHAEASASSSYPDNVSPLYPKPEGVGFTGRSHKETLKQYILHKTFSAIFRNQADKPVLVSIAVRPSVVK